MNDKISSLEELYARLLPALKAKQSELHKDHMIYITPKDIWHYFRVNKWNQVVNLTLFDMVEDILNTNNEEIDLFVRKHKERKMQEESEA